jgi:hypothetical protein
MSATVKAIPEGHHTVTPYLIGKNAHKELWPKVGDWLKERS